MITVKFLREDKEESIKYKENFKIDDVLKIFGYSSETAVVQRNGKINTEEETVKDNDEILIIPVVSGG
ncbi:MAG: MoaD/ThiS family protein [Methanomicrobia archaeon]|nr:MoaD/ThiS family protein [Methanomicrobia archaeon]